VPFPISRSSHQKHSIPTRSLTVYNRIMSSKIEISTPTAPAAIGPYSQAVRVGNLLFTSGQIPIDPTTGDLVYGDITQQTTQVCENLKAVLLAAELDFAAVIKTTVFLKSMGDFAAMNAVYAQYFKAIFPARSTVQVAALPKDALVEVECVATYV
jgi:2-iminobutanoate/2-iminopropanoate deaminase